MGPMTKYIIRLMIHRTVRGGGRRLYVETGWLITFDCGEAALWTRVIPGRIHEDRKKQVTLTRRLEQSGVVLKDATVHHHFKAGRASSSGGRFINDAQLHPDDLRLHTYRRLYNLGNILWSTKDIYDFN